MSDYFDLGIVTPAGGSPAMYSPAFYATAQLAVHELNESGGVLGREVRLRSIRVGPHALVERNEVAEKIFDRELHGLIVCHDSHVRELIVSTVQGRIPIYYPPIWEGGLTADEVISTGDDPHGKIWPTIQWLAENAAARDWIIVGTDYQWPTGTARAVEPLLLRHGWWHGTHLVPYSLVDDLDGDERVVSQLVDAVEVSSATCVLVLLHGSQMAMFNREFASRNLDERVLRFAPMADEAVLLASGAEATRGLITAFGNVEFEKPAPERSFLERYFALHGSDFPEPSGVTLAGFEGVAVASAVVGQAGTLRPETPELARVKYEGFEFEAPSGLVRVEGAKLTRPMSIMTADGVGLSPLYHLR